MTLEELRKQIDEIDTQMCDLFARRMETVGEVAKYKKEHNMVVYHPSREREVLLKVSKQLGPEYERYGRSLYHTIFDLSECYQSDLLAQGSNLYNELAQLQATPPKDFPKRAEVACAGSEGSYAQMAAERLFEIPEITYTTSFEGVFKAVNSGLCEFGILPVENSMAGTVNDIYDLLTKYGAKIVRSARVKVEHSLLAHPGAKLEDIKEIYSHQQAISQCSQFLESLKGVRIIPMENTATAAKMVAQSEDIHKASISSSICADLYGLKPVKYSIQNRDNNYTRFICISKNSEIYTGANRTSIMMVIPHKPGSLFQVLSRFNSVGVNLVKLESRLIPEHEFEYRFYFDIEASAYSHEFVLLMNELSQMGGQYEYFGTYTEII